MNLRSSAACRYSAAGTLPPRAAAVRATAAPTTLGAPAAATSIISSGRNEEYGAPGTGFGLSGVPTLYFWLKAS